MNKILAVIIGVLVIGGLIGYAVTRSSNNTTTTSSPTPTATAATATPASSDTGATATPASGAASVTINNLSFAPASITVAKGTKVTWTNQDSVDHTVTADTASSNAPASSTFGNGQTYSFTFNTPGTYTYHCSVHPFMTGTVVVTN